MAKLEDMRRWMAGEDVHGLPPRNLAWDKSASQRAVRADKSRGAASPPPVEFWSEAAEMLTSEVPEADEDDVEEEVVEVVEAKRKARPVKKAARVRMTTDGKDAVILFGRHSGKSVSELSLSSTGRSYLHWIVRESDKEDSEYALDFTPEFVGIVRSHLSGVVDVEEKKDGVVVDVEHAVEHVVDDASGDRLPETVVKLSPSVRKFVEVAAEKGALIMSGTPRRKR